MAGFTCLAAGAREFAGFPGRARHGAPSLVVGGCGGVHAPGYRPGLVESGHRFRIRGVRGCRCVAAAIRARWMFDVRFGCKTDAIGLLLEWVSSVGAEAGLTARNTHIGSGLVGSPESRLEMEVEFPSLQELEAFWQRIPGAKHRAWSERAKEVIVDASPRWEVLASVPVGPAFPQPPVRGGADALGCVSQTETPPGVSSDMRDAVRDVATSGPRFRPVATRSGASGATLLYNGPDGAPEFLDLQFGSDEQLSLGPSEETESGLALVRRGDIPPRSRSRQEGTPPLGSPGDAGVGDKADGGAEPERRRQQGRDDNEATTGERRGLRTPGGGPATFSEMLRDAGADLGAPSNLEEEVRRDRRVIEQSQGGVAEGGPVDWKGDPMVINPGDVLPFVKKPKDPRRDGKGKR